MPAFLKASNTTRIFQNSQCEAERLAGEEGIGVGIAPGAYRAPDGSRSEAERWPLTPPPNTRLEKFNEFMQRIADLVGIENATVISSDQELKHESYPDPSNAHDV